MASSPSLRMRCPGCGMVLSFRATLHGKAGTWVRVVGGCLALGAVLALKGNQEALHRAVITYIDRQMADDFALAGAPAADDGRRTRPGPPRAAGGDGVLCHASSSCTTLPYTSVSR